MCIRIVKNNLICKTTQRSHTNSFRTHLLCAVSHSSSFNTMFETATTAYVAHVSHGNHATEERERTKREWMNSISFLFILMDFYYKFEYHHIFFLLSLYRYVNIFFLFFIFRINYYAGRGTQIVYENALSNVHIVCRWRQQQQQPIANKWCVSTRCRLSTHVAHSARWKFEWNCHCV